MKTGHKVTLELTDDILSELKVYKKRAHITNTKNAIFELLKYALTLPPYFSSFDWQKAEKEADNDIASGNIKEFSSADDLLADLKA